ncbi:hypothetical protein LC55x_4244 [Lysobacter capsici]|nr:hypothetical protein LC55x_4244 [Lysobacter capsici]
MQTTFTVRVPRSRITVSTFTVRAPSYESRRRRSPAASPVHHRANSRRLPRKTNKPAAAQPQRRG